MFSIKDKETKEPIEDVFLFLEQTSIGTITDFEGHASLSLLDEPVNVVVTHILYETVIIPYDQLKEGINKIELVEKVMSLEEVTIRSKKVGSRKRKKWLKRFEKAFFGPKTPRRKVKILNPEVLWFEETEGRLEAYAVDNLKILNRVTGYKMQFTLEDFSLSPAEDVSYRGKIFFEDIKETQKKPEKIKKARDEYYLLSSQLFFKSLVLRHPVNEQRFEFGTTRINEDGVFMYQKSSYDELNWSFGPEADTLILDEFLTVLVDDLSIKSLNASGGHGSRKLKFSVPSSSLRSKSGRFIIGRDGTLHNQDEIEEFDYWSTVRMAKELPRDYAGPIIFNNNTPSIVVEKLLDYQYKYPGEKVYLHTDKSHYLPYNTLWFKGYIVDAVAHMPGISSQVLYVDLISPDDEILKTWLLHEARGLKGDYLWRGSDPAGEYKLRGYTNYMRNQGLEYFFEKRIILQDMTPQEVVDKGMSRDTLQIGFYPEGGDLIVGQSTNVTFQCKNQKNQPLDITGQIVDDLGHKIADVKSVHKGLGQFMLIPEEGRTYHLITSHQGVLVKVGLPKVQASGLALSVNAGSSDNIFVSVIASEDELLSGAFLVGHVRGQTFSFITELSNGQDLKLAKSDIPPGVVHFTLFDGLERPHSERLVFNDYGYEVEQASAFIDKGSGVGQDSLKVVLAIDSAIAAQGIDMSVTIKNNIKMGDDDLHIKSYLLLASDLSQDIPDMEYYLNEMSDAKRYLLDLMMLSMHWRRFTWKDIVQDSASMVVHQPEVGYTISGYTTEKDGMDPVQSHILLTSLSEDLVYDQIITSKDGRFRFPQMTPFDSTTILLQGRIVDDDVEEDAEVITLKGNRLLDIYVDDFTPVDTILRKPTLYAEDTNERLPDKVFFTLREQYLDDIQQDSTMWQLEAPDVEISARRSYRSNRPTQHTVMNLDNIDYIEPTARGTSLLTMLAPRRSYRSGPDPSKIYSVFINRIGEQVVVPIQIVIDGMGAEPGGSNAGAFWGLSADMIKTIFISKTSVVIETRDIPRSREEYLKSGIIYLDHPGYYKAREFSADFNAERIAAYETTLHWDPDVVLDESGSPQYSITIPDLSSSYIIDVQGVSRSGELIHLASELVSER